MHYNTYLILSEVYWLIPLLSIHPLIVPQVFAIHNNTIVLIASLNTSRLTALDDNLVHCSNRTGALHHLDIYVACAVNNKQHMYYYKQHKTYHCHIIKGVAKINRATPTIINMAMAGIVRHVSSLLSNKSIIIAGCIKRPLNIRV